MVLEVQKKWQSVSCFVFPITNNFFGESVNVTGLITGQDLLKQLQGKDLGEELLIPSVMLRYDGEMFLDGVTIEELQKQLHVRIKIVQVNGKDFLNAITGKEKAQ